MGKHGGRWRTMALAGLCLWALGTLGACTSPHRDRDWQRRTNCERQLEIALLELAQARIGAEHGELTARDVLSAAEKAFELAKRRQQVFTKMLAPHRIARAELDVQRAADVAWEAEEELRRVDQTRGQEQPADPATELAMERAQRRLQRAQRARELQQEELARLEEVMLPLEQMELELAAEQLKHAWQNVHRDNEQGLLDRQMALLRAEAEVRRCEQMLTELHETSRETEPPHRATAPPGESH